MVYDHVMCYEFPPILKPRHFSGQVPHISAFQKKKRYQRQQQSTDKTARTAQHTPPTSRLRSTPRLHNHTLDTANSWPWRRRSGSATSSQRQRRRRPGPRIPPARRPWRATAPSRSAGAAFSAQASPPRPVPDWWPWPRRPRRRAAGRRYWSRRIWAPRGWTCCARSPTWTAPTSSRRRSSAPRCRSWTRWWCAAGRR